MNNFLESQVDKLIVNLIKTNKGFGWKNHPNRNHTGIYISGEPFDYCILTAYKTICFDAKQTIQCKWVLLKKDKKQAITLKKIADLGIESFFLIYFSTNKKLMKIDINKLFKILPDRKFITINDCEIWNYKELLK